ncbi:MAG: DUF3189 family protein [Clostridiales bacterium]|jgi:hypothetical protein|nr:DUF3189 family protein [Clostridiales bacterium]
MNYVYLGVGDLYLPAVAAAIHLNRLDINVPPDLDELLEVEHFRHSEKDDEGELYYIGNDEQGNKVFVTCVKGQTDVIVRVVQSLLGIYRISIKEVKVIPCEPENPQVIGICKALRMAGLTKAEKKIAGKLAGNCFADLIQKAERPTEQQHSGTG